MKLFKHVLDQIHRRSLWQVLGLYLAGAWVVLQVVSTLREEQILPGWAFRFALALLLVGLPIVLLTAFVQKGVRTDAALAGQGIRGLFTWRKAALGGMAAFAAWGLIVTGWLILGDRGATATASPEEESSPTLIAVFPFAVRGSEDLAYLSQGMVDLLAAALDGSGELRAVDPFALLSLVRDRSVLTPEEGRSLASDLHAGHYVMGSLIEAGQLRFRAAVYGRDGALVGDAEVIVPGEEGVYRAVDGLAREIVGTLQDGPAARIPSLAARTTTSLPALKAYLEGERAYRAGLWEEAVEPLRYAVALDSTFAMAWYRLAVAGLWTLRDTLARESVSRASSLASGLGERDRRLIQAASAWIRGDGREAARLYRELLAAHPDELEGWLGLSDVLWHYNPLHGLPAAESREPLRRALELDPDSHEALIHLRHTAAFAGRWTEYDSLAQILMERSPDHYEALITRAEQALATGDAAAQAEALQGLRGTDAARLSIAMVAVAVVTEDPTHVIRVARLWTEPIRSSGERAGGHVLMAYLHAARGRLVDAGRELDAAAALDPLTALEHRSFLTGLPFFDPSAEELRALRSRLRAWDPARERPAPGTSAFFWHQGLENDLRTYLLGYLSVRLGEFNAALSFADSLETMEAPPEAGSLREDLILGLLAQVAREVGGAEAALDRLASARMEVGWPRMHQSPFHSRGLQRYLRGLFLIESGAGDQAAGWLDPERWNPYDLVFDAPSHLALARFYDESGDGPRAANHYQRFVDLWSHADPEFQPALRDARERLRFLGGRPGW